MLISFWIFFLQQKHVSHLYERNAEPPTYAIFLLGFLFKISSRYLEHSVKEESFFLSIFKIEFVFKGFFQKEGWNYRY